MTRNTLDEIEHLATQLSVEDQRRLIEHLNVRNGMAPPLPPEEKELVDLRDIYKGKFPENVDLEAIIHEIRSEWLEELDELDEVPKENPE